MYETFFFLFEKVKYLDSLELKDMQVSPDGTRVSVWTNAMVKKAILQDTNPDGTFGAAPVSVYLVYIIFFADCYIYQYFYFHDRSVGVTICSENVIKRAA